MFVWITICSFGVFLSLAGERQSIGVLTAGGKILAASAYIAAAWSLGATETDYGRILLVGMVCCWLGDLLLISTENRRLFLLGLGAFLFGHIAYAIAFTVRGLDWLAVAGGGLAMTVFAIMILRWLKPFLNQQMQRPVLLYVIAISMMMAMAIGTNAATANRAIPIGALLFVLSDLAVARDRFISPGFINRAWGLPLYFLAQMILASSVV